MRAVAASTSRQSDPAIVQREAAAFWERLDMCVIPIPRALVVPLGLDASDRWTDTDVDPFHLLNWNASWSSL